MHNLYLRKLGELIVKKTILYYLLLGSILSFSSIPATIAAPLVSTPSPAGQYDYFFNDKTLSATLTEFARNNGLTISISKNLSKSIIEQRVNGRFTVNQIEDLLQKLGHQYGFNWFVYAGNLYITSTKSVTVKIDVAPQEMGGIRDNLVQMGLYDSRFGYSEMPAEDKLLVTGPQEYVELVNSQITKLGIAPINQQFAIFRLKYANASDMQFTFNNQQIVIPGVATILNGLLQNNQVNSATGANRINASVGELLKNPNNSSKDSGSSVNSSAGNNSADNSTPNKAAGSGSYPLVQADARLNTIVIRDKSSNLAIYKNLISALDVPAPLIQVEVLVFKLDQDKLNQAGINWFLSGANASVGFGTANLDSGVSNNLSTSLMQLNPGSVMVTNGLSFSNSLQFLEQHSFAQTVAKPSLATIDSIPAMVTINKNYFYGTAANAQSSGAAYSGMQVTQALQITPHVIAEPNEKKSIMLSIVLNDGSVDQLSNSTIPSTTQSQITSQALLKEGQSIILAGYTKDVAQEAEYKVPGLGDIPGVGWLFKTKTEVVHKEVTLYLVTPKIIWERNTYKLGNYITVGDKAVNVSDEYQIGKPTESASLGKH